MYITYKNKMAHKDGDEYTNLIDALSADVTNDHSAYVTTPDEEDVTSKTYKKNKDYWLEITQADINGALVNLIPYDTSDTTGSSEDVQAYAFNSSLIGGSSGAHFVRYILSKCIVINDPIKTGKLIEPLDSALASIEETFGDAEIIIQNGMQGIYDNDSGSLTQLIAGLATHVNDPEPSHGMIPVAFTYGDSNDTNEGEWKLSKQTVSCSISADGDVDALFRQINRLCAEKKTSLDTNFGRSTGDDASAQFVVGDVLLLSKNSVFKTTLNLTHGENDTLEPNADNINDLVTDTDSVDVHDWSGFEVNTSCPVFEDGNVFLQVVNTLGA